MRIIYKSFDGLEFDSAEECQRHENTNPLFKMYGKDGMTDDTQEAYLIHILDANRGAKAFIELCEYQDCCSDGFDSWADKGWYYWDGNEWGYLTDEVIKTLEAIFKTTLE